MLFQASIVLNISLIILLMKDVYMMIYTMFNFEIRRDVIFSRLRTSLLVVTVKRKFLPRFHILLAHFMVNRVK